MPIGKFVRHTKESNFGGGNWLQWKDDKKIIVWLHTKVEPLPVWSHSFMLVDVVEDKDNDRATKRIMRYPRFVSPDPETVHRNQHFRNDSDVMKIPPDRDAFLILREWLRHADHIGLDDAIFEWRDPKDNKVTTWTRGEISGRVKRAKANFSHSLDTRQEYMFAVAVNDSPEKGIYITREAQLLGRKVGEVIAQQQEMLGEEGGDPLVNPYPFVWTFDPKARSPMDMYDAYKAELKEYSQEIIDLITDGECPDLSEYTSPRDGDQQKIREAFEAAAQVDLPLDEIFSEDSAVRLALCAGPKAKQRPGRSAPSTTTKPATPPQRPTPTSQKATPAPVAQARPAPQAAPAATKPNGATPPQRAAAPAPSAPQAAQPGRSRRRKVEPEPEPAPPPEEEKIPCESCGHPMGAKETKCAKCGAEYEIDDEPLPVAAAAPAKSGPAPKGPVSCFACGGAVEGDHCTACNLEQTDPIPF